MKNKPVVQVLRELNKLNQFKSFLKKNMLIIMIIILINNIGVKLRVVSKTPKNYYFLSSRETNFHINKLQNNICILKK